MSDVKNIMKWRMGMFMAGILLMLVSGCSRKHQPQAQPVVIIHSEIRKPAKKQISTPIPKVITVDDRGAQKAVDGRLYYDLEGRRYWRNYVDGRYYLFNKNMYTDPAFKPH